MSNDVINDNGKDVVVREDTAKAYRGVNWALISIAAFAVIAGIIMVIFFAGSAADGKLETPANATNVQSK